MTIPKFKKQYQEMIENHKEIFESLKTLKRGTEKFQEAQRKALRIIRINEDALCRRTENTGRANFSTNLADKFLEEIQAEYPEVYYS